MESQPKIIFILAGSKREFDIFHMNVPDSKFLRCVYADRVEHLGGYSAVGLFVIGRFWKRPDASAIHDFAVAHIR